jgi:cell division protein FtsI/penicillin-binding protein 2
MRSGAFAFLLVSVLLAGGAVRLGYLEYTRGEALRAQAQRQHTASLAIPAQRGEILDARGRRLAESARQPSVFVDPTGVQDARYAAYSIAPVLGLSPDAVEVTLLEKADRGFVWIKRGLSDRELDDFNEIRRQRGLNSFGVQYEPLRAYPFGHAASHVLGFVGAEHKGLAGVELAYDEALRGVDGRRSSTVDSRRRRLRPDEYVAPRDGGNVVLTLDVHIQQRAEYHLRHALETFKAQWATAVVMDPLSGEVLAMATLPDFDPGEPVPRDADPKTLESALERTRNRAIGDSYEPGSIFKPFIASPALEAGITRLDEVFVINGPARQFGGRTINDTHAYDALSMRDVIAKSSNIGMGMLGGRIGNERLHEFVRRFGFGDPTGIGLPGEHPGLVQDFSRWTSFSTNSIPIGQEIAVTPIQVVTAFSVFCNDGVLFRPRIVRGVIDAEGGTLEDNSRPIAVRRVLDAAGAREFRMSALVETVNSGTGRNAALEEYQVFGKTGTAQIARSDGRGYEPGAYVGSFVCGAPATAPRVAVLVSLYRPSGGKYYGGTVSAPCAAAIVADALTYLRVPADVPVDDAPPSARRKAP